MPSQLNLKLKINIKLYKINHQMHSAIYPKISFSSEIKSQILIQHLGPNVLVLEIQNNSSKLFTRIQIWKNMSLIRTHPNNRIQSHNNSVYSKVMFQDSYILIHKCCVNNNFTILQNITSLTI